MAIQTTFNKARDNFESLLQQVTADREIVIINRRSSEDVALVVASELSSLLETAHLLRSPKNTQRLLKALHRVQAQTLEPNHWMNSGARWSPRSDGQWLLLSRKTRWSN